MTGVWERERRRDTEVVPRSYAGGKMELDNMADDSSY